MIVRRPVRTARAAFSALRAEFIGPGPGCVYWCELGPEQVSMLAGELAACAARQDRCWFSLTVTRDNVHRLKLTEDHRTPRYESDAARSHVRGDVLRIQVQKSLNIVFSPVGARLLHDALASAAGRMAHFLRLRACVPRQHRSLIEFVPDSELAGPIDELDRLAAAGEAAGGEVLPPEDFSDWETPPRGNR
jgi:hypothetical protein